jgi:hypothetical protein
MLLTSENSLRLSRIRSFGRTVDWPTAVYLPTCNNTTYNIVGIVRAPNRIWAPDPRKQEVQDGMVTKITRSYHNLSLLGT